MKKTAASIKYTLIIALSSLIIILSIFKAIKSIELKVKSDKNTVKRIDSLKLYGQQIPKFVLQNNSNKTSIPDSCNFFLLAVNNLTLVDSLSINKLFEKYTAGKYNVDLLLITSDNKILKSSDRGMYLYDHTKLEDFLDLSADDNFTLLTSESGRIEYFYRAILGYGKLEALLDRYNRKDGFDAR
ncbi:hypothetical protein ACFL7D_01430 [candidate division KSB1 bacterium]